MGETEEKPSAAAPKEEKKKKPKEEKKEIPAKKTALGDTATMKRILDDSAIKVVLDPDDLDYVEDCAMSNLKLIIGFASVASSGASHAYPAGFPNNWWVLLACCAFYFICSGILQLLLSFVELESILLVVGKPREGGGVGVGLNFSSHFPRFQEMYTLGITPLPKGSLGLPFAPKFRPSDEGGGRGDEEGCAQRSWPVNLFFDEEGTFVDELFDAVVRDFVKEYQSSQLKKTN